MTRRQYNPREALARIFSGSFARCLYPGLSCQNDPIRAHSIQNAAHLGLIERDGHVVQIVRRLEAEGPTIRFDKVGRNKATTFLGLCGDHDTELFRPIEQEPIDVNKPEHLFLLAYRAAYRGLYTEMDTGAKVQQSYLERIEHGLEPKNQPSPAGLYATQLLIQAYETFQYKTTLDQAYLSRKWETLNHDVRLLDCQAPSLAVSALFSPNSTAEEPRYVAFSVVPITKTCTAIILSHLRSDSRQIRRQFRSLLRAERQRLAYETSRLVLNSCENFVLAPMLYETWPDAKRNAIMNYFKKTLFRNDWTAENPELNMLLAA